MNQIIAQGIFWCTIIAVGVLVYQLAVLPGIRLGLRYRTFGLRDELRALVIQGSVKQSNPAFELLHNRLTFMSVSLSTYDLARLTRNSRAINEEERRQIEAALRLMEEAPEEIKKIYQESLKVYVKALICNSLFFFVIATSLVGVGLAIKVGFRQLRQALVTRVKDDTQMGFLVPELAAV